MFPGTFAKIDWQTMPEDVYQIYISGKTYKDKDDFLTPKQIEIAKQKRSAVPQVKDDPVQTAAYKSMAAKSDPDFQAFKDYQELGNFWYWLSAFWKEADADGRIVVLKKLVTSDGKLNAQNADLGNKNIEGLSEARKVELRTLLKGLMDKGLKPWSEKAKVLGENYDKKGAERQSASKLLPKIDALGVQFHGVGFRGDARDPATLSGHDAGAFIPKTQSPFQISKYNMDKAWNPFSDQKVRDTMYWREGQADNDLFTVVSVAKDFATSTKFPLIDDPPVELVVSPVQAEVIYRRSGSSEDKWRSMTVSRIYVYMVLAGEGYDTEAYQISKFPEIGVDKVPADNFLATLRVVRIHYGAKGDDGHLAYVESFSLFNHCATKRLLYAQTSGGTRADWVADDAIKEKFADYVRSMYNHHFFNYSTAQSPKLVEVLKCPWLDPLVLEDLNKRLKGPLGAGGAL